MNATSSRAMGKALLAAAALALASGCIVVEDHEPEADLTFFWTFDGYDCWDVGVSQTVVEIWEGDYLHTRQSVPCDATGVTIQGFAPGWYTFYIDGLSPSGRYLYGASGNIQAASGNNTYDVTLHYGDFH